MIMNEIENLKTFDRQEVFWLTSIKAKSKIIKQLAETAKDNVSMSNENALNIIDIIIAIVDEDIRSANEQLNQGE